MWGMKIVRRFMVPILVLLALSASTLSGEETARLWTSKSGKSVKGVLKEKEDGWVKILIKSRIHKIQITTLSEEDQK
jgi:hypothetical protein